MGSRANPAVIGAFVIGAVALAVLAAIALGAGRLFQTRREYVAFFQGDVNGLSVGAPVKFKGVRIGAVTRVLLNINVSQEAATPLSNGIRIPVVMELEEGRLMSLGAGQVRLDDPRVMKQFIDAGLRAQLAMESFVTGVLYVDLDIHRGMAAQLFLPPGAPYQEIPTVPRTLEQAQSVLTEVIGELGRIDFKKVTDSAITSFASLSQLASSPELRVAVKNLAQTEQSLNRAAESIRQAASRHEPRISPARRKLARQQPERQRRDEPGASDAE